VVAAALSVREHGAREGMPEAEEIDEWLHGG
jgi:sugar/nucleoside kinase (ribokinase family)